MASYARNFIYTTCCEVKQVKKIAFLIRSLHRGGAERQLVNLAVEMQKHGHQPIVVVYYLGGALETELVQAGVQIFSLEKRRRWDMVSPLIRLLRFLRRERPTALYSFLPTSNVMSLVGLLLLRRPKIVWGVRSSFVDLSKFDRAIGFSYFLERKLSFLPDLIIYNSESGKEYGNRQGIRGRRDLVIPNGIDVSKYTPDLQRRTELRHQLGLEGQFVIGTVGRIDPMKDHITLLKAIAILSTRIPQLKCIVVGDGDAQLLRELKNESVLLRIEDKIVWLGAKDRVDQMLQLFDVFVMTSIGEGFPNALAEAMSVGLPVVATAVGDCRAIVGDMRWICPPANPQRIADTIYDIYQLSDLERADIAKCNQQRISGNFSIDAMYHATMQELCVGSNQLLRSATKKRAC